MKMIFRNCVTAVLSLSLLTLTACGRDGTSGKAEPEAKVTAEQKLPKLLDLGAKKCIPCKMMAPILEELTAEYKGLFDVEFIDVWQPENKEKAKAHGIRTIPTQIFFAADGKELWRHVGFISKEDILNKWKELGFDMKPANQVKSDDGVKTGEEAKVERWEASAPDSRDRQSICYLSDATVDPGNMVSVATPQGEIRIRDLHHYFILYTSLTEDKAEFEKNVSVTDWSSGKLVKAAEAACLTGTDEMSGRPWIRAFADRQEALKVRAQDGGSLIAWDALKRNELSHRCGFCDRACYPQDAAEILIEGVQSYGCCAHCAMGVAARTGKDIEVRQPDGLTGEMIVVKTVNGSIASIAPEGAVAWFGKKKTKEEKWVSAGCFHQGFFTSVDNLKKWLAKNPLETGEMITIQRSLADKMKLSPQQIQKACKIGECSPR